MEEVGIAARDAVPFLVITLIWTIVSTVLYGIFLLTKPDIAYPAWAHASVFLPGMIGYAGHALRQALSVRR
ncbi:MAG: hypothetical protein ABEH64_09020 [Salinirussus sp.]